MCWSGVGGGESKAPTVVGGIMGGIAAVRGRGDGGPDQGEGCGDGENQVGVKSIHAGSGLSGLAQWTP